MNFVLAIQVFTLTMVLNLACGMELFRVKRQNFNFSSNTPPANQTCAQEPNACLLPFSFCKNGGTCEFLTVNCSSTCNCLPPYTGRTCREIIITASGCQSNACDSTVPFCTNGGTCNTNQTTCRPYCLCREGFKGDKCQLESDPVNSLNMTTTSSSTTLLPFELRYCAPQFVCSHGICDNETASGGAHTCICNDGYSGKLCETACLLDCGQNGKCNIDGNEETCSCPAVCSSAFQLCSHGGICMVDKVCRPFCLCPENFTGNTCETELHPTETVTLKMTITFRHSLEDRKCAGGFVCRHGVCDKDAVSAGVFKCICDDNYIGSLCAETCPKDCGENGGCYLKGTEPACACHYKWEGEHCDVLIPEENNDWIWWVVGSCIVLMVLLVLLIICLPVWLWKRREVFIMKIVHYFQPYEDADGKLFDAFISYKSHPDDEEFVLKQIYPKLEKQFGFKLCLHFRDFQVGETIANNILWAVENSRRTVLIISPNYLGSEFARFEYQTAQLETLRLRQRIVPVLLKDVTDYKDKIDPTLKNIMQTITYLEWPLENKTKLEDRFWKRLVLSLPKRKDIEKDISNFSSKPSNQISSSKTGDVNLVSFKHLDGKNTDTLWTDIPLDNHNYNDSNTPISHSDQNGVIKNEDVKLQFELNEICTEFPA